MIKIGDIDILKGYIGDAEADKIYVGNTEVYTRLIPNRVLYYTTYNYDTVTPTYPSSLNANIISNTYVAGLGTMVFDDDLTTIGESAFVNCEALTSIVIPDSVTTIGDTAFRWCTSLSSVTLSSAITRLNAFSFANCSSLLTIDLKNVGTLKSSTFYNCISLESVSMANVTYIESSVFNNCTSLTSITFSSGTTRIWDEACRYCTGLTSITCNATTPPELGIWVFNNTNDCTIYVPTASVATYKTASGWSDYANRIYDPTVQPDDEIWYTSTDGNVVTPNMNIFGTAVLVNNTYIDGKGVMTFDKTVDEIPSDAFYWLDRLASIAIPTGVTSIETVAFSYCTSLTSVTIPNGVTYIGSDAFSYSSLTGITIPDSVTTIDNGAFQDCLFSEIVIPSSVTTIGNMVFHNCLNFTSITCNATLPPSLGSAAFDNTNDCTIYVPTASVATYKTASGWSDYANRIYDPTPRLNVTPTAHTMTSTGGQSGMVIDSNENWTLTNNADWISLSQVSGSSGSTNVLITIDNYTSTTEDRSATITASTSMFTVLINVQQSKIVQQANEIWYTSTDGNVINPNVAATAQTTTFGANITSNTYTDGKGVISFDGTVTGVGGFSGATTLSAISLTSAVTTVAQSAFSGCVNLKAFDFTYVSSINSSAFSETSLESINIPAVATILSGKSGVFMSCTALTSVTIAEGVRYLGSTTAMLLKGMFENCTSLQNVVLPSTLINVGYACFKGCISLQTLSMGGSLDSASTAMGKDMVSGCTALTSIVINQARPPKLLSTSNPFSGDSGCPIYVPSASVDTYKAATGWKTTAIANRIQAIP